MRGLEHFRAAGADRDGRLEEAVEEVRRARRADGRWPMYRPYPGRYWFTLEERGASRWSTLRALRVLAWWDEPNDTATAELIARLPDRDRVLRRSDDLCDEVAAVDVTALTSCTGGTGTARPPQPHR
jgi:hypothetical protein